MALFDFFKDTAGQAATGTETAQGAEAAAPAGTTDSAVVEKVRGIIEELRPYLQSDGGDCELIKVEDNVAYVRLVGACVGCPSSIMTLRSGVENRIKEAVPEIEAVEML